MSNKKKSEFINQRLRTGNKSINLQIGTINLSSGDTESKFGQDTIEVVIPMQVSDFIYKGRPNSWINVIDFYKKISKKEKIEPNELLRLITTYDISRIRKLEDAKNEILFMDTSWLSHDYSHWNNNTDMNRWLMNLTEISEIRAKKGLKTSRVFFWKPSDVTTHEVLFEVVKTINMHLSFGIEVYLSETTDIVHPVDFQLFGKKEGLVAYDFTNYDIEQLSSMSDNELALELFELIKANVYNDKTIKFQFGDLNIIREKLKNKCELT